MPSRTKEEYEEVINKLLGTNIKWSKLSLEELIEFAVLLDHPELFMEKLGVSTTEKEIAKEVAAPIIGEVTEIIGLWKEHGQGPFAKLYRKIKEQKETKTQAKT